MPSKSVWPETLTFLILPKSKAWRPSFWRNVKNYSEMKFHYIDPLTGFAKIICTKFKYNYTNVRLRNKKSFFIQICFGILFHLKFSLKITQCTSSKLYFLETAIFELVSYFPFLIFDKKFYEIIEYWIYRMNKTFVYIFIIFIWLFIKLLFSTR